MPKRNSISQVHPVYDRLSSGYMTKGMKRKSGDFPPLVLNEEAFKVATFMLSGIRPELSELLLDSLVQKYRERPDVYQEHRDFYKIYVDMKAK
tara:strand:- start:98 stop:376 length:279 start_codon:yes stop_codon:yes gene_type:complete